MKVKLGWYRNWFGKLTEYDKVEVTPSDVFNADHTLAKLIVPVLRELQRDEYFSMDVDNEDVPPHLHRPGGLEPWDMDNNYVARSDYVLKEMIYAFEETYVQSANEACMDGDTCHFGCQAGTEIEARVKNGRELFAKYFDGLWT